MLRERPQEGGGASRVKTRSPLRRTEPSARGVSPATADAARPATGGRAARPQDATAQAVGRNSRRESSGGRIVKRTPASFSHLGAAQDVAPSATGD